MLTVSRPCRCWQLSVGGIPSPPLSRGVKTYLIRAKNTWVSKIEGRYDLEGSVGVWVGGAGGDLLRGGGGGEKKLPLTKGGRLDTATGRTAIPRPNTGASTRDQAPSRSSLTRDVHHQ